jgi:hypothetical protein
MRHLKTTLAVLGAVTILVLAGNTIAMATTGHALLLGKVNTANKATTVKRTTPGPAVQVLTKSSSYPPFAVNGKGRVANLNTDLVDGLDSSALLNHTYTFHGNPTATAPQSGFHHKTGTVPAGYYLASVSGFMYAPKSGTPAAIDCQLLSNGATNYSIEEHFVLDAANTSSSGYYTLAISGLLRLSAAGPVFFSCTGPVGSYSFYPEDPLVVNLSSIGKLSTGTTAAARIRRN